MKPNMPESTELRYLDDDSESFSDLDRERAREAFTIELARTGLPAGARLLEIGFGKGWFLDWARDEDYSIAGSEISPACFEAMKKAGHEVYFGPLDEIDFPAGTRFDAAIAFDVFEHLTIPELVATLKTLHGLLADGGIVLARFPNGASPLGGVFQAGDITHRTALNQFAIGQLCQLTEFSVQYCGNAARTYTGRKAKFLKWLSFRACDIVEMVVAYLYFRGQRVPLDANMVCVLRK